MRYNANIRPLRELADIQTGPFGSQLHKEDYVEVGTPIVTVEHLGNRTFTEQNLPKVSDGDKKRLEKYVLSPGDIVFSRVGSVDRCSYVDERHSGWMFSGRCLRIRPSEYINPLYLYYYFCLEEVRQFVRNIAVGATMPSINTKLLGEVPVSVPSIQTQRRIAAILSSLDDKIELNNKINANLEQQAQALFRAWFVDFEPFGGKMPEDWRSISLSAIADFVSGYSYKGGELQPSTTAMVTIKNFDRVGGFKLDGFKELMPSNKIKRCHYTEMFDTVVAHTDLTQKAEVIGNAETILNLSGYKSIVFSMDLVKVVPKAGGISKFLLAALLKDPRFKAHCLAYVSGTTVLHLSKKALPDYMLSFPKNWEVLAPLDTALTAFYTKMATLVDENCRLRVLRDTLLPKLMSGEIDVSDVSFPKL